MHRGYVKVWRKLEDSGILQDQGACQFFLWAMFKAMRKPRKQIVGNQVVCLCAGQFISGRNVAATELGISPSKFARTLDKMKMLGFVDTKPNNKFTVITIVNWDTYQNEQASPGQQTGQQIDSKRTASEQQTDTNKKDKKERIKTEDKSSSEPSEASKPSPVILTLPLVGKDKEGPITQADLDEWQKLFPGIDVLQVCRNIVAWNHANPTRRKTITGYKKHVVSWLAKEQDKGRGNGNGSGTASPITPPQAIAMADNTRKVIASLDQAKDQATPMPAHLKQKLFGGAR
jgi:hypothetical protein